MRIGFDVRPLQSPTVRLQGMGYYTAGVLKGLARLDHVNDYVLCMDSIGQPAALPRVGSTAQTSVVWRPPLGRRLVEVWNQLAIPWQVARAHVDVFHITQVENVAWWMAAPTVVTLHDMLVYVYSRQLLQTGLKYRILHQFATHCDALVAVSESTKADIVRFLGVPPERVTVIPEGVDEQFRPVVDPERLNMVRDRYHIVAPFILYVGDLRSERHNSRKNVSVLIEAFSELAHRDACPLQLVLAGKVGEHAQRLRDRIMELGLTTRVVFTDFVSDADLPALYSAAEVFAYPSRYEGFGLPVLEAMACGTPVVCSNTSSLPEVAGDATLLVAPDDVTGLAEALHRLIFDAGLRVQVRERGLNRASRFTWDRAAEATLDLYERVAVAAARDH